MGKTETDRHREGNGERGRGREEERESREVVQRAHQWPLPQHIDGEVLHEVHLTAQSNVYRYTLFINQSQQTAL